MQNPKGITYKREFDNLIFIVTALLVAIGAVMILSASQNSAIQDGTQFRLFLMQLFGVGLGFAFMFIIPSLKFEFIMKLSWLYYFFSIGLLVLTLFAGETRGGATRWLLVPGINFQIQPSEFAKIAIILTLPLYIMNNQTGGRNKVNTIGGILGCGVIVGVPIVLVVIAGGMSTAIIFAAIGFAIYFVASPYFWRLIGLVAAGVAGIAAFLAFGGGFRGGRFAAWLDPYSYAQDVGFQTIQSLYAVASGGLFGLGLGNSNQKLNFLPEAHNDFIFAIIVEEMGILFGIFILILFGILLWRGAMIAIKCSSSVGTLMATGILTMIAIQVLINIGVVTNTIPNTGIPLPFISYGGTSIMVMMASIGLLLNISRNQKMEDGLLNQAILMRQQKQQPTLNSKPVHKRRA